LRLAFGLGFATIATFPRQAFIAVRIILRIIIFPEIALLVIAFAYILIVGIWHTFVPEPRPWYRDLPGWPQYPAAQTCPHGTRDCAAANEAIRPKR
jgi:hypothetical protein